LSVVAAFKDNRESALASLLAMVRMTLVPEDLNYDQMYGAFEFFKDTGVGKLNP